MGYSKKNPICKNMKNVVFSETLWVIVKDDKIKVFNSNGEPAMLNIVKDKSRLHPSKNRSNLNRLDASLYVNIASSEEDMRHKIKEQDAH
jgi:hypothetical protein